MFDRIPLWCYLVWDFWWEFSYKFSFTTSNQFAQIVYFFLIQSWQVIHFSKFSFLLGCPIYWCITSQYLLMIFFFYISMGLVFVASPQVRLSDWTTNTRMSSHEEGIASQICLWIQQNEPRYPADIIRYVVPLDVYNTFHTNNTWKTNTHTHTHKNILILQYSNLKSTIDYQVYYCWLYACFQTLWA